MRYGDERLPERFWAKVAVDESGCWLWTAKLNPDGYGRIRITQKWAPLAHRALWETCVSQIQKPMELDHLCRVRHCVNPSHLELVSHAENVRRGNGGQNWSAKTHCPQGHPYDETNTHLYDGKRVCKQCTYDRSKAHRKADPERHREAVRRYKERNPEVSREYRKANREQINDRRRAWRADRKARGLPAT